MVADVAALATTRAAIGDTVTLLGYYASGDGCAPPPLKYSVAGGTVDNGFVFDAPGTGGERFVAIDQSIADGKCFGAKGDNTADDTARCQAAINSTAPRVNFSNGTFRLTDTLTVAVSGKTITGGGSFRQDVTEKNVFQVTATNVSIDNVKAVGKGTLSVDFGKNNFVHATNAHGLKVTNCSTRKFNSGSVQLHGCTGVVITGNYFGGDETMTSVLDQSADVNCYNPGRDMVISNNVFASDLDGAINIGSTGEDRNIAVSGNVFTTHNAAGAKVTCLNRRHCIVANYYEPANSTNGIAITGNVCDGALESAIYFIGRGGVITITSNTVMNSDLGPDTSIGGGIMLNGAADAITCVGNAISGVTTATCGAITVTRVIGYPNNATVTLDANVIADCNSYGILLYLDTEKVHVSDNMVWNTSLNPIRLESTPGKDADGIRISGNMITTSTSPIGIFLAGAFVNNYPWVHDNDIFYIGTPVTGEGAAVANCGIYCLVRNLKAYGNHIKGFAGGITIANQVPTGRSVISQIDRNHIEDALVGVVLRANAINDIAFIGKSNTFDNVTAITASDNSFLYPAGRIADYSPATGKAVYYATSAPTTGTWVIGDRTINIDPALGEPREWICTIAGAPGTWEEAAFLSQVEQDRLQRLVTVTTGTTPSVLGARTVVMTYGSAATVTNLTNGVDGQYVTLAITNGNITLDHGSTIKLSGAADYTPGASGAAVTLVRRAGVWEECSRIVY